MVETGELKVGGIITVLFAITAASISIGKVLSYAEKLAKATASAQKLFQAIDRVPSINSLATEGIFLDHMKGNIQFKGVSFNYDSRPGGTI